VRHVQDLPYPDLDAGSVVTIGAYDGLHLGHQQLLERVIHVAEDKRLTAVVMSFEPTPKEFFGGSSPPARLMRFREKFESLEAHGIDLFYCPRFAAPMRDISAADFVRRILVHGLNARYLVVGDDFHFARRREGTIEHLNALAGVLDYDVEQVSSVVVNGIRVSSTAIRDADRERRPGWADARISDRQRRSASAAECGHGDLRCARTRSRGRSA
jgi:riboflavin kinase/FMN adenylyltransferase